MLASLAIRDVVIRDSLSDAISVVGPGSAHGDGTLSNSVLERVRVDGVGLGTQGRGLWIRRDARGELRVVGSTLGEVVNESKAFVVQGAAR